MTVQQQVKRALCIAENDTISTVNDAVEMLGWRLDVVETVQQAINSLRHDSYEAIISAVALPTPNESLFSEASYDHSSDRNVYKSRLFQQSTAKSPSTFRIVYALEAVEFPDIREACFECGADATVRSPESLVGALLGFMTPPEEQQPGDCTMRQNQLLEIAGGVVTRRLEKMVRRSEELKQQLEELPQVHLVRRRELPPRSSQSQPQSGRAPARNPSHNVDSQQGFNSSVPSNIDDYRGQVHSVDSSKQHQEGNSIRVVHISDTNNEHRSIILPEGNLFIHSGNFTDGRTMNCLEQFEDFLDWLERDVMNKFDQIVFIAGHHEFFLDTIACKYNAVSRKAQSILLNFLARNPTAAYLENTDITYQGLKIYGTCKTFMKDATASSARELPVGTVNSAFERPAKYAQQATVECDILVTHRPPSHIFSACHYELPTDYLYNSELSSSTKSPTTDPTPQKIKTKSRLFRRNKTSTQPEKIKPPQKPRLHAFGHYGRDFGIEDYAGTLLLNASQERVLREDKRGGGTPLVVDVPLVR